MLLCGEHQKAPPPPPPWLTHRTVCYWVEVELEDLHMVRKTPHLSKSSGGPSLQGGRGFTHPPPAPPSQPYFTSRHPSHSFDFLLPPTTIKRFQIWLHLMWEILILYVSVSLNFKLFLPTPSSLQLLSPGPSFSPCLFLK